MSRSVSFVLSVATLCLCLQGSLALVQGLGSPLKVAQCRAKCIHTFPNENLPGSTCAQNSNCQMCWDQCQRLQAGWSASCDQNTDCKAGCRQACRFHLQLEVQRSPVLVTRGEEVIQQSGDVVTWPAAATAPSIFVLMCRQLDNSWTQVVQTLALSWRMVDTSCSTVRVMVVGLDGLVTVYSPVPRPLLDANLILRSVGKDIWQSLGLAKNNQSTDTMRSNDVKTNNGQDSDWNLREVSLIHQGVLVIAEVAWDQQRIEVSPVYLVTWELAGGGLKGNLLTDSTCVTLSLWPDTVYRIQVQVVQEPHRLSEPLVLDTRQATPLLPTPRRPAAYPVHGHPGFEGVAGAACAVLLFLAVLLLASSRCRSSSPNKNGPEDDLLDNNHFKLFPPPVTLLLERPSPELWPLTVDSPGLQDSSPPTPRVTESHPFVVV